MRVKYLKLRETSIEVRRLVDCLYKGRAIFERAKFKTYAHLSRLNDINRLERAEIAFIMPV